MYLLNNNNNFMKIILNFENIFNKNLNNILLINIILFLI